MMPEDKELVVGMEEERISLKEAAYEWNLSYGTVRVYISKKRLKPIRPKGRRPYFTRVYVEEVKRYGFR